MIRIVLAVFLFVGFNNADAKVNSIKSKQELLKLMDTHSPLDHLSKSGKTIFSNSITFSQKGVSGFNSAILVEELTLSQIDDVLHILGLSEVTPLYLDEAQIVTKRDTELANDYDLKINFTGGNTPGHPQTGNLKNAWCSTRATCSHRTGSTCITKNC